MVVMTARPPEASFRSRAIRCRAVVLQNTAAKLCDDLRWPSLVSSSSGEL